MPRIFSACRGLPVWPYGPITRSSVCISLKRSSSCHYYVRSVRYAIFVAIRNERSLGRFVIASRS
jgi:hypothetical protein